MKVPNKIKVFGWRACQNALPTRENLVRCRVVEDGWCEACKMESESVAHVLWQCGVAQDIWAGSIRKIQKTLTGHSDFNQLVATLTQRLTEEELELFWVQCWTIWNQRNVVMHGGKLQHPFVLTKRASDFLIEYKDKQALLATSVSTESVQQWRPPTGSVFKLNFDAAMFSNKNSSGVGAIVRNCRGEVMAGLSARGPPVGCSEEAEVLACRKALEFALNSGFSNLVVEGDNVMVMKAIVSPHLNRSRLGHIYDDISTLALGFRSFYVNCIKRNANAVAHCLARYASQLAEDVVWMEESPPPALQALYSDLAFLNE